LNTRALAEKTVVYLALMIFSFLIILGSIKMFISKADDVSGELICRGSVAMRDQYSVDLGPGDATFTPLLCKTYQKDIPIGSDKSKEKVNHDMAELIKRCWWQFGTGFSDDLFNDWFGAGNRNDCFVCYTVRIEDVAEIRDGMDKYQLETYLSQTKIKAKDYDKEEKKLKDVELYSYRDYVQQFGGLGRIVMPADLMFYPKKEQYAIAIVSPSYFADFDLYKALADLVSDDTNHFGYIFVDEYNDIKDKCEIVVDIDG